MASEWVWFFEKARKCWMEMGSFGKNMVFLGTEANEGNEVGIPCLVMVCLLLEIGNGGGDRRPSQMKADGIAHWMHCTGRSALGCRGGWRLGVGIGFGLNLGSFWVRFFKKLNKDRHSLGSFFQKMFLGEAGSLAAVMSDPPSLRYGATSE